MSAQPQKVPDHGSIVDEQRYGGRKLMCCCRDYLLSAADLKGTGALGRKGNTLDLNQSATKKDWHSVRQQSSLGT
jgi:hypothetical protein